ncbi:hypothetical protein [Saccharibacillus kuerlensis]|uniref:Uncharacterized protein n=1 Tax=Saccharibacillus kuerlensis TaxID=459527 RepID=A0ABQ2L153_9BACL|nr:hypothetical protein [Saccharibacillus kuerlensis]GGN98610.1 hypothetical protein GCM10010969_17900 [Saccharibacillus kuerlensis]
MRSQQLFSAILVLLISAAAAYLFFSPTVNFRLYESEWLPGFLVALTGAGLGMLLLFPHRHQSVLCRVVLWGSWAVLLLYVLVLTPFAVLLFGP